MTEVETGSLPAITQSGAFVHDHVLPAPATSPADGAADDRRTTSPWGSGSLRRRVRARLATAVHPALRGHRLRPVLRRCPDRPAERRRRGAGRDPLRGERLRELAGLGFLPGPADA